MLWCIVLFNYADRQALSAVLPLLRGEMRLSPFQLGLLGSAFAVVYGLLSPLAGWLADRVQRRSAILGGLHVWSAVCLATAFVPGFNSLLVLRGAEGLGEAIYFPASMSMISEYHGPASRSRAIGFHQTGVYAGIILGTTAAGWIGQVYGWRWSFAVFGSLGIALALVLHLLLKEPPAAERSGYSVTQFREVLSKVALLPAARNLLLAFICANLVSTVLFVWMPTYIHDRFGKSLALAGLTATLFVQVAAIFGAAAGGYAADSIKKRLDGGRILVQSVGLLAGAPFVFLAGRTGSMSWIIVGFLGWGFFKGVYEANIFASMFDVMPSSARGTVVGVMNMAAWFFGAGGPVIVGWIAGRWSLSAAISSTAIVYVVGAVLLWRAASLGSYGLQVASREDT
jgi:MFS family permease